MECVFLLVEVDSLDRNNMAAISKKQTDIGTNKSKALKFYQGCIKSFICFSVAENHFS